MNADIVIVGSGIVGASFALQLRGHGLRIVLIDPKPVPNAPLDGAFDHRVYAITPTNMAFLDSLDIFQAQDRARFTAILGMEICADRKSKLDFSARGANRSELATMIEHRLLATRLHERLSSADQAPLISRANPKSIAVAATNVSIRLDDDTNISASLLIGADGGDSWVRNESGFALSEKDYDQVAVVANFLCERSHGNVARQWFIDRNILAWLPLGEKHISIVWSVNSERGKVLLELQPAELCQAVNAAGENMLGGMTLVSPVASFPLRSLRSESLVKSQIALMGDAAHVIHPLAGQGLNLGLQDALTLAQVLAGKAAMEGLGDLAVLRRYERARVEAIVAMHGVTDGLHWLFASRSKWVSAARGAGLGLTDKLPWLKNLLIARAIG